MVCCWSKQRQAWTRARRVNRCGGALTAPSRPTGTWRRDASPRSCSHRVLPANTILACHATTLQPRPFASKDRRNQLLLRVQPERNGKRKRDEAPDLAHLHHKRKTRALSSRLSPRSPHLPRAEFPPFGGGRRREAWTRDPTDNWTKFRCSANIRCACVCVCVCTC